MLVHVFESAKTPAEIKERSDTIVEAIKSKEIAIKDLSIRDIAEATLGADGMRSLANTATESAFVGVQESVAPVNLSAFTNITGQLIYQGVMEQYSAPTFIGSQLVTEETSREDNTRVPGLSPINDDAMVVEEGGEYPDVKFGEDYVDIPSSKKRGLKIGVTREAIFFDRTGQILEMARGVGERMGMNKEVRILRVVLGVDNTYKRKGVTRDTYVSAAESATDPRKNEITQALTDYTSIDAAMQAFANMTDDRTVAEPIQVMPNILLTTVERAMTAKNILNATEVRVVSNTNNTTVAANPIAGAVTALTSPWIKWLLVNKGGLSDAAAKAYWYIGDPRRAFRYRTLFPMQVLTATHDKDAFERDVMVQYRADERGVAYVWQPWYMLMAHE